jgi:2-methylcitrate dehydratase
VPSMPSDPLVSDIVDFLGELKSRPISRTDQSALTMRVADAVGCGVFATSVPEAQTVSRALMAFGGQSQSTLLSTGRTSVDTATCVNGFLIRFADYNDTYFGLAPCHPSDLVSAALAVGEERHSSGREILEALRAGYHLLLDFCDAVSLRARGWDHATFGGLAGTAVAGRLLRLTPVQIGHAISLAVISGTSLCETRSGALSTWKALAFPDAVARGVRYAYLAERGITGPATPFVGTYGFVRSVSGPLSPQLDSSRERAGDSYIKPYAAVYWAQSSIEMALAIREKIVESAGGEIGQTQIMDGLSAIEVRAGAQVIGSSADTAAKWRPPTRETADHSLPFLIVLALKDGTVSFQSIDEGRSDSDILAAVANVMVYEEPEFTRRYPEEVPVSVAVEYCGQRFEEFRSTALGHTKRPLTAAHVRAKFLDNCSATLPAETAESLWHRLEALPYAESVDGLLGVLALQVNDAGQERASLRLPASGGSAER